MTGSEKIGEVNLFGFRLLSEKRERYFHMQMDFYEDVVRKHQQRRRIGWHCTRNRTRVPLQHGVECVLSDSPAAVITPQLCGPKTWYALFNFISSEVVEGTRQFFKLSSDHLLSSQCIRSDKNWFTWNAKESWDFRIAHGRHVF